MEKEEILQRVAPCSLMCHTCEAYEKGVICESARRLLKYMDGVKEFHEKHNPSFVERYRIFEEELERCSSGICSGCRNREHHGCSIKGCFILDCTKDHDVDFCGECGEFPCNKVSELFEEEVYIQWLNGNKTIKDSGIDAYWLSRCDKSHYGAYKK